MPAPGRFPWIYRIATLALTLLSLAGLVLMGWGIYELTQDKGFAVTRTVLGAAILGFAGTFYGLMILVLKIESASYRIHTVMLDLHDVVKRFAQPLDVIAENSQISEGTKSIAHRQKERDMLRKAIREDIFSSDWEAAYYLIDEMERRFGYRAEAERLRQEVDDSRQLSIDDKIDQAIAHVEKILDRFDWERAKSESDRLARLFPNNDKIRGLPGLIEQRKEQRKGNLLKEWNTVVSRNDIDQAIEILKDLDHYLSPSEAKALEESVRGVFKAKLAQIGVQFSLAVTEKRWADALEIGLQIMEEFPNSQMAREVNSSLEGLKQRAGLVADAEAIQQRPPEGRGG